MINRQFGGLGWGQGILSSIFQAHGTSGKNLEPEPKGVKEQQAECAEGEEKVKKELWGVSIESIIFIN